jgi:4-amino-4-deoxy-L-arabinose transferase-like glycosyltransferase
MFPNRFTESLWGDEAFSAVLSQRPLWPMIQIVARDTSPPLYYLAEHFWFELFGTSELAIRSLSFLFHLGTVMTLALVARYLWDKKTAIWAALVGFLNPFLFGYAFEGRMYALLAFMTTVSFYGYFRAFITKKPQGKWKLFYAVTTALALYSHHFALFAVAIQGLWVLPSLAKAVSKKAALISSLFTYLWPFGLIVVFYLPWLPALYHQTSLVVNDFWLGTPTFKDLLELIRKFAVGAQEYQLCSLALALVGALLIVRRWQRNKLEGILVGWFLGPLVLTWAVSQVVQSIFFDRYMLFAIPGFVLLLASGRRRVVSLLGLLLLSFVFMTQDWSYFAHLTKRPFRELAAYVKQTQQPTDRLINWNSAAHHLWETKYYGIPAPIYAPGGPLPFYVGTAQMTGADVIATLPETQRLGVITSGPVEEVAVEGFHQVEVRQFDSLKVIWLEKTDQH